MHFEFPLLFKADTYTTVNGADKLFKSLSHLHVRTPHALSYTSRNGAGLIHACDAVLYSL